jgi:hypothetical protein
VRKFRVEVSEDDRFFRIIRVRANTVRGALRRARKSMRNWEAIYQVTTRVEGCNLEQPVWDFFNGNISRHFGLRL